MIDSCSRIQYQPSWGFKREPSRPVNLRLDYCGGMKFDDNFDWDNAWYDALQITDNIILLIGPPLYDKKGWINSNIAFIDSNGRKMPCQFMDLDRVSYTALTCGSANATIKMLHGDQSVDVTINRNDGIFNGRKVMVTLQKNNPLPWIRQWVSYHSEIHGVDGCLIYDNGSTDYTLSQLEESLSDLNCIVRIVDWRYPYGPQGSDDAPWDSDYGQYVMLEHAKYRYLSDASLVLNNDVDEFLVLKDNITLNDIQGYLNSAQCGCLRYKGIWIEPYDVDNGKSADVILFEDRHVKDYYCTDDSNKTGIGHKWMLVPWKHMNNQWAVHNINGPTIESDQLHYAHYLALNTNWSWKRDRYNGVPSNLKPDQYLKINLDKMVR